MRNYFFILVLSLLLPFQFRTHGKEAEQVYIRIPVLHAAVLRLEGRGWILDAEASVFDASVGTLSLMEISETYNSTSFVLMRNEQSRDQLLFKRYALGRGKEYTYGINVRWVDAPDALLTDKPLLFEDKTITLKSVPLARLKSIIPDQVNGKAPTAVPAEQAEGTAGEQLPTAVPAEQAEGAAGEQLPPAATSAVQAAGAAGEQLPPAASAEQAAGAGEQLPPAASAEQAESAAGEQQSPAATTRELSEGVAGDQLPISTTAEQAAGAAGEQLPPPVASAEQAESAAGEQLPTAASAEQAGRAAGEQLPTVTTTEQAERAVDEQLPTVTTTGQAERAVDEQLPTTAVTVEISEGVADEGQNSAEMGDEQMNGEIAAAIDSREQAIEQSMGSATLEGKELLTFETLSRTVEEYWEQGRGEEAVTLVETWAYEIDDYYFEAEAYFLLATFYENEAKEKSDIYNALVVYKKIASEYTLSRRYEESLLRISILQDAYFNLR